MFTWSWTLLHLPIHIALVPITLKSIRNLWKAVRPGGALCILDFRRVGWLCRLPVKLHELEEIRASYTGKEMKAMFGSMGITDCQVTMPFPYLTQIVVVKK
ncbi:hypothetical protein ACFLXA_04290 [Chloroflexota bacterium]